MSLLAASAFSSSMISITFCDAFRSKVASTSTWATLSREISPVKVVSSRATTSEPDGAASLSPPGRTIVKSSPDFLRYFSATSFSSSAPPKAFVITKPGFFSCPISLPLVRIDEINTNFFTPVFLAASTSLMVPSLSTAWASFENSNGLPGTKPVAQITASTPETAFSRSFSGEVTSNCTSSTLPSAMPSFFAFSRLRTPAMIFTSGYLFFR
mmetsp:Transcript_36017/g.69986  ORF Transcript_36017/g.69986 Transcript_36017/m.69986 type:complete len:212 (-) Transcript_36017:385-1020(-)